MSYLKSGWKMFHLLPEMWMSSIRFLRSKAWDRVLGAHNLLGEKFSRKPKGKGGIGWGRRKCQAKNVCSSEASCLPDICDERREVRRTDCSAALSTFEARWSACAWGYQGVIGCGCPWARAGGCNFWGKVAPISQGQFPIERETSASGSSQDSLQLRNGPWL